MGDVKVVLPKEGVSLIGLVSTKRVAVSRILLFFQFDAQMLIQHTLLKTFLNTPSCSRRILSHTLIFERVQASFLKCTTVSQVMTRTRFSSLLSSHTIAITYTYKES